jgi:hypothetical protein
MHELLQLTQLFFVPIVINLNVLPVDLLLNRMPWEVITPGVRQCVAIIREGILFA